MSRLLLIYAWFLSSTAFGDPLTQCYKAIGDGWQLTGWAFQSKDNPLDAEFNQSFEKLCEIGCFALCAVIKKPLRDAQLNIRHQACIQSNSPEKCREFFEVAGIQASTSNPCLVTGGKNCYDPDKPVKTSDAFGRVRLKIACLTGVDEACQLMTKYIEYDQSKYRSGCETGDQTECSSLAEALYRGGKATESLQLYLKLLKKSEYASKCFDIGKAGLPTGSKTYRQLVVKSCKEKFNPSVCRCAAEQLLVEGADGEVNRLLQSVCRSDEFKVVSADACATLADAAIKRSSWKEAEELARRTCDLRKIKMEECTSLNQVLVARNPSLNIANADCKESGSREYYDQSGMPVAAYSCVNGMIVGDAWFGDFIDANVKKGVREIVRNMVPFKGGVVHGILRMKSYVQGPSYSYFPIHEGVLRGTYKDVRQSVNFKDGLKDGEWLSSEYGRKTIAKYREGEVIQSTAVKNERCDAKSEDIKSQVLDVSKIGTSVCEGMAKDPPVVSSNGMLQVRKFKRNGLDVIQNFEHGYLSREIVCDAKRPVKVKHFLEVSKPNEVYAGSKILDVSLRNGAADGDASSYYLGVLKERAKFKAGKLIKSEQFQNGVPCAR